MKSRLDAPIGVPQAAVTLPTTAPTERVAALPQRLAALATAAIGPRSIVELKQRILSIHASLAALASLAPSPKVNVLFGELVALSNAADAKTSRAVLDDPAIEAIVPGLRRICAKGEGELEAHWAKRIIASATPARELTSFPYFQNYEQLARLEANALRGISPERLQRAVFIGSGPMPLSSIMLATRWGMQVDNLDIDADAVRLGAGVAAASGMLGSQRFLHGDIDTYAKADLGRADVVCVAALAGLDVESKTKILETLAEHMRPGALLMLRSADRLRRLLYPVIEPEDVVGFAPQSLTHPLNDVVNSVLVCEKPL